MQKFLRIGKWGIVVIVFVLGTTCLAEEFDTRESINLDQAIQIALDHSIKRKIAVTEVDIAKDKIGQAYSGYFPRLTLSGGIARLDEVPSMVKISRKLAALNNALDQWAGLMARLNPGNPAYAALSNGLSQAELPDDGLTYTSIKFRLEQPLYTGGKLSAINRQAQLNLELAKFNLITAEQNLIFEVKKAYYTVLQLEHLNETIAAAVKSMENHSRETKLYYQAGQVPELDIFRAEAKLGELQQKQLMLQNSLILAYRYFNFLLGVDLNQQYKLIDKRDYTPVKLDLEECKSLAVSNRADLQALKIQKDLVEDSIIISKSGSKPLIALIAEGEHKESISSSPEVTVSLVATINILDGGLIKNQVAEAEHRLVQVKDAQQLLSQGIALEVEQAYRNLENALKTIEVSQKALKQSEETSRMAKISYQAGLCSSLELIDAEVGLTQAQNNYFEALNNYYIVLAQLEKAMGVTEEALLK